MKTKVEPFPKLMEYKEDDTRLIVLFEKEKYGTVVFSENSNYQIGSSRMWDMSYFKDLI